jgi:TRAP-type mannitol/chloroaromatic compound transport system substrate-binding protein
MPMSRRTWSLAILPLGTLLALAVVAPLGQAEAPRTITWKMQSTWTAGDFHHVNPTGLVRKIEEMSGGRLKIELVSAGAVVPPLEVLDAVNRGILDAGHAWPGYWTGKHPAATLFGSAPGGPYGMNAEDYLGWIYMAGGLELYNELLQKEIKLNVVALPTFGETPEPMGWFKRPMKTVAEFKGVKFRAAGMSAEVFREMGMSVVTLAGGEIVPGLERGVVDAAEFSDPSADMSLGLHNVRKFYHMPGIHQPTGIMEFLINRKRWEELPTDLKAIVQTASMAEALHYTLKMLDRNSQDLATLVAKGKVTVVETPREMMVEILKAWDRVAERRAKENPFFGKVLASQKAWAERVVPYRRCCHPQYDIAADYYWGARNPYRIVKP